MLKKRSYAAIGGKIDELTVPEKRRSRRAEVIPVRPKVSFPETRSKERQIIEVVGRDRPGLLWQLADTLRRHDIDILSAHIENVGIKAMDTFYVRSLTDISVSDKGRQTVIRKALMKILSEGNTKADKAKVELGAS